MIPEFGQFALILVWMLAVVGIVFPGVGLYRNKQTWLQLCRPIVIGQAFFAGLAFLLLILAFVSNDFSVRYVAIHSNSTLPLFYQISAAWAGHEGSFLLWILLLVGWMVVFAMRSKHLPLSFTTRVFIVLEVFIFCFSLFLLLTSNPFARLLPHPPIDGNDLNPLLQDPGLVVHPPLLYMGYVGLSIPFALAVAVLWAKSVDLPWAQWIRAWVLGAFAFLTLGITLGSFWAYYELGWGGWWFWDPVENASFVPWLLSIALIHSLMMSDKRKLFQGWSLLLCIVIFATTLIGAFLIRSGVLTSVHRFASDPERGLFILVFITLFIGSAFGLYAYRVGYFLKLQKIAMCSRESVVLLATLFLFVSAVSVLLGTIFPLFYEAFTDKKISVGFPYFNRVFVPLILPVVFLAPMGPIMHWGKNNLTSLIRPFLSLALFSGVLGAMSLWLYGSSFSLSTLLQLSLGLWVVLGTIKVLFDKIKRKGLPSLGATGLFFAHSGVGLCVIGVVMVNLYQIEKDVYMERGQVVDLKDYQVQFSDLTIEEGPNYIGYLGHFTLSHAGKPIAQLFPEKRIYVVQRTRMSETDIHATLFRDIYISLGERLRSGGWSVRVYYKPFIRWIWLGGLFMALGSLINMMARRYQARRG